MAGRLARLAGDLHAAVIEFRDAFFQTEGAELVAVGSEGVGLEDVRPGPEVSHVNAKYFLGARGVQLVHAALRPQVFVQQRAHGAVRDERGLAQPLLEFVDSHGSGDASGSSSEIRISVYRFDTEKAFS